MGVTTLQVRGTTRNAKHVLLELQTRTENQIATYHILNSQFEAKENFHFYLV